MYSSTNSENHVRSVTILKKLQDWDVRSKPLSSAVSAQARPSRSVDATDQRFAQFLVYNLL